MRVNWVSPWDREDANAVAHDDMLAFTHDLEASPFQRAHSSKVRDTRELGHASYRDFDLANVRPFDLIVDNGQVLSNRVLDILERFWLGGALGPAPREARHGGAYPLLRALEHDFILHLGYLSSNLQEEQGAV